MKYDIERIATLRGEILKYLDELEGLDISSPQDLKGALKYHAVSMMIFQIINRAIDLGEELLGPEGVRKVSTSYREIFVLLRDKGTISAQLQKKLDELVKTRNILAHEYEGFVEADIFEAYQRISAVRELLDIIEKKARKNV